MKLDDSGSSVTQPIDVVQTAPPQPAVDDRRFRFVRGWIGPCLLVTFGIGVGIALSVAVKSTPIGGVVAGEGGPQAISGEDGASGGEAGAKGPRYATVGGRGGTKGSSTAGQDVAGQAGAAGSAGGGSGGATGVTSSEIRVAANIVTDGPGASFLKDAITGVRAVFNEANVKGIHGRKISLTTRNDSWDAATGLQYIQNYIAEKYFALAVNPSSEGLDAAVKNGTIDNASIPVVGTDGMLISQYRWPADSSNPGLARWVWPVAASTVSTMHIAADYGKSHYGAQSFGLVYDKQYRFGVEGAEAFRNQLSSLGVKNVYTQGIEPGQTSYTNDANTFNNHCGDDKCDLVAMLLDPSTAITWIGSGGAFGKKVTMGPQTLFNNNFASQCFHARKKLNKTCNNFLVWTGYNPPIGKLANDPDVAKYVSDVRSVDGHADVENSFTQGAYIGAKVFVAALQKVGPNLTRDALRQALDSMSFDSGLSNTLSWSASNHFANTKMQGFIIGVSAQGFTGWQNANTDWVPDTRVGKY